MMDGFLKKIGFVLLIAAVVAGLSSCGRRGDLQSPNTATVEGEVSQEQSTPATKPDREFILDSVI